MGIRRGLPQVERALTVHESAFEHPESPHSTTGLRSALGKRFKMKQQTITSGIQETLKKFFLFVHSKFTYSGTGWQSVLKIE